MEKFHPSLFLQIQFHPSLFLQIHEAQTCTEGSKYDLYRLKAFIERKIYKQKN